jgi:hypothetical protein
LVQREFLVCAVAVDSHRHAQIRPIREQMAQCILDHLLLVLIKPGLYQVLGLNELLTHIGLRKGDSVPLLECIVLPDRVKVNCGAAGILNMKQEADGLSAFVREADKIHRNRPVFSSVAPKIAPHSAAVDQNTV